MKYQYIFFDLDGTLTDSALGITNSVAYALRKRGIDAEPSELNMFIGPPLVDSFQKYYGMSHVEALQAIEDYREHFVPTGMFENTVYDGVPQMLRKLKESGRKLFVATCKPEVFSERIIEHFEMDKYFEFVAGSTLDEKRITKPEVISYALERAGITDVSGVVMVGDRCYDVNGAAELGMDSIAVHYGYGNEQELANATFHAKTAEEVTNIVLSLD